MDCATNGRRKECELVQKVPAVPTASLLGPNSCPQKQTYERRENCTQGKLRGMEVPYPFTW